MTICYKVVKKYDKMYTSYVWLDGNRYLKYTIGEITKPVITKSKLFVFNTLENAQKFIGTEGEWYPETLCRILKCETEDELEPIHNISFIEYEELWNKHLWMCGIEIPSDLRRWINPAPRNTYGVSSLSSTLDNLHWS